MDFQELSKTRRRPVRPAGLYEAGENAGRAFPPARFRKKTGLIPGTPTARGWRGFRIDFKAPARAC
jgi:hypothetical protein